MPRKTKVQELTSLDKKYIDLAIEKLVGKTGKVVEQDWLTIASDLEKDAQLVKEYADIVTSDLKPKEVEVVPVSPQAAMIRNQLTPRDGFTIMTGNMAETIDKNPANFTTKGRNDSSIYKGNPRPKRDFNPGQGV